ncbi:C-GCAxxG-C-C family protein [Methanomassiliicoccus luminyensis]|jgi:C_GCAxxG_C_C family probable redox protein|uniref:C-GCAxxG-C-C family protein n=1 Tax=Methanomassiliicoccus luminyensis TaxID=1080712 RepID=UPI00036C5ABA|nr:C-GCAxxG-C-C family protein [Methanomassiliicoccus luminyensis]
MDERTVCRMFNEGFACSQICLSELSEEVGIDQALAKRIAALFGGGAWSGEMCGAVSGCIMALGLRYGNCEPNDLSGRELSITKMHEFKKRFEAEYGSIVCRDIMGYDISTPEGMEKILEENLFETRCAGLVCRAIQIARGML